jgi:HSP20 family protein
MAITPYRPSTDLFRPLLEDFFGPIADGERLGNLMRAPAADVIEGENEIRVTVEMPGMKSEDLNVDLENNVLTISGEKHEERAEEDKRSTWHLTERRYGHFSRSFVLPRDVEQDGIRATFENGILNITVPKSERARRRRINIDAEGGRQQIEASSQ